MKKNIAKALSCVLFGTLFLCQSTNLFAQQNSSSDSLRYPLKDRRGDRFTWQNRNSFNIGDTSILHQTIEYDAKTKQYFIIEKIGKRTYRKPTYLTFKEFYELQKKAQEAAYFKLRTDALFALNKKLDRPKPIVYPSFFDRTFGLGNIAPNAANTINNAVNQAKGKVEEAKNQINGAKGKVEEAKNKAKTPLNLIDIKPTGNIDIMMGYQGQFTNNPTLPERARRTGGFDFDMNANVGVNANIGDKLKLPINYNTQANFDFSNQIKLDYKGTPDQLLKSIEAGNIGFEAKGTLIPSATNLFGFKTSLQFGKLTVTAALANQRSTRQSQTLQGGAAVTPFQKKLSEYEENRHFLVAQHFRKNFNTAMSKLPVVTSQINISRIEVWVTNRNGATVDARDVIGFTDLAEGDPNTANPITNPNATATFGTFNGASVPNNSNNGLYQKLASDPNNRISSQVNSNMLNLGLQPVRDYEKTFARKLNPNEYTFNPQLGMLSLNSQLLPDEVLGVAYEYSLNGKVYKVGEFSQEVALDTASKAAGVQKMLFLKLLKATSARVQLPIWRLMMKNVYSLDMVGISRDDFKLNILYDQPSGGLNRYLPQTNTASEGRPLIALIGLDRLNNRNDPQPDGVFDFVEGFTIYSQYGRIILPKLEPFGADLKDIAFTGVSPDTAAIYLYPQLYDSIKAIAQTYANLDRFVMQGQSKGSGGSEIYLNGYNIPPGSVRINAGGQLLIEGSDYTIDYNLGQVKILNQAILSSGVPVQVSYENNATFGIQQKGFLGLRADYKASKNFQIGATMERLNERPFFTKMNIGEDPVRNTIYGVDFSFKGNVPKLTKWLDKLPFYSTKTMSTITAYGEGAYFKPGHPPQIGSGGNGLIYIDDFEGTRSSLDLRFPLSAWSLASTPQGVDYPEAALKDSIPYGYNRAKLAWYNIESNLQDKNSNTNPLRTNLKELSDPRVRQVYTNELFPQQTTNITNTQTQTFDLSFYPEEIGPYNYIASSSKLNSDGSFKLNERQSKWGGIMRAIDQTDFETNNFEFIEFWTQDPFIHDSIINGGVKRSGGKLKINLGNISEDLLKDGKRFYENGMPTPTSPAQVDSSTTWGRVPTNPIQMTSAFSNDPNDRVYQDVGFDGLDDDGEKRKRKIYLDSLVQEFGGSSPITIAANNDPSHDNYVWYRDAKFDNNPNGGILNRYKNFNNPQGNSPIATGGAFSPAATLTPDNEDLNRDNTINETEQYYEYEVDIMPGMNVNQTKYITDKRTITVKYADGTTGKENWFLFRIPLKDISKNIGGMTDFKSIRFMRMYMTGWDSAITMRFARLDLVRNQWRGFNFTVDSAGKYDPINQATNPSSFSVLAVNLEENSSRTPVNYVIPPGIERVQQLSNNGVNLLLNEQALSMRFSNLRPKQSRAVFKTLNMDIRQYGKLRMFAHLDQPEHPLYIIKNNDMNLVVRIGQDFLSNYYEVRIPLQVTPTGKYTAAQSNIVWPDSNNLDINIQDLIALKVLRNNTSGASVEKIFRQIVGYKTLSIYGNPNLGEVRGILVGVENTNGTGTVEGEVWINELRLSDINEVGAYAALGRVDLQLADLGKLSVSVNTHTQGFGSIESKIGQRSRDNLTQFDAALTIDAGKLVPKEAKLSIPVYASISKTILKPQYDPYDKDILYQDKINAISDNKLRDSIKNIATDQTTIKTINVTNLRVAAGPKPKLWSLSNFDFSFSYTQTYNTSPTIAENKIDKYRGTVGYNYQKPSKYIEPFKKLIKSKSKWFQLIKDFNFNPVPSTIGVRADVNRQYGRFIPRIVNTDLTGKYKVERVDTTYDKYFNFDRFYTVRWDVSKSLNLDFNAVNNARVDEPYGALNTKAKKDSVKDNFFNGGRNTYYTQKSIASYTLPLSKFPLTDWITARYSYNTFYNWIGASRVAVELGNSLENGQDNTMTAQFDLSKLYNKSRLLRSIENPLPKGMSAPPINDLLKNIPSKEEALKGLIGKPRDIALTKWKKQRRDARAAMAMQRKNQQMAVSGLVQGLGRVVTMLKTVQINYTEGYKSRIPGWMDSTQAFGQNFKSMQPGIDYVFGKQPDAKWLERKAALGLFTRDSNFNLFFSQKFEQKLNITAQLEPIKEFTIDLTLDKTFSKDYQELYKDTLFNNASNAKSHLNPSAMGGFSVSFISFNTLFGKHNPNEVSDIFKTFESYRSIISQRLAKGNAYWSGTIDAQGFATGYDKHHQDVLIPAFIAAYTKQDPNSVALIKHDNSKAKNNPFSGILPKPNWRMSYTGLTKVGNLANTFSSINISHQYSGTLSMNGFNSALQFSDPLLLGVPKFRNNDTGNYIPFFLVPNITIQEQFQPLIGIDITTTNQLNLKFEYKKSRTLSLSLIDYQLAETNSTEWTIGGSFRKKGAKLPGFLMKLLTKQPTLANDLSFKLDLSMRDDATSNSRLDQLNAYGTGGQKVITIQPSIDYVLNNRLNIKFFFDQRKIIPYISTSAPTTNTRAGIQLRISLQ